MSPNDDDLTAPTTRQAQWNDRYAGTKRGLFGEEPNHYLRMIATRPDFGARTALLLADGDGRNGTWLAKRGVAVTAVDFSAEATKRAINRDVTAGVEGRRIAADLAQWLPDDGQQWQAAIIIYLHGNEGIRRRATRVAADALAPNGWLLVEGFAKEQASRPNMGPEDAGKLWAREELDAWLPDVEMVESLRGLVHLDEGPRHQGLAEVVRYAGRKRS